MALLTAVFQKLIAMALGALPVMGAVLLARLVLSRAPKKVTYLLWAVVAFRLLCPVSWESPVGLGWGAEKQQELRNAVTAYAEPEREAVPVYEAQEETGGEIPATADPQVSGETAPTEGQTGWPLIQTAACIWLVGMAAGTVWLLAGFWRLRRRLATAVHLAGKVWECDGIPTPFVLGLLRPRIYIPFWLGETERAYVLAHENCHLRWGDPWAKALGLGLLVVYWWDPAVWLCWVMFCRDMEMRCDEAVLASMGPEVKQGYSLSLVSFALDRSFPPAVAFGEHDAARRVRRVLRWKRAAPGAAFLAVAAVALVWVVCGTDGVPVGSWVRGEADGTARGQYTYAVTEEVRSLIWYEEIYHHGQPVAVVPHGGMDFAEAGTSRRGAFSLDIQLGSDSQGDGGQVRWIMEQDDVGISWSGYGGPYRFMGAEPREGRLALTLEKGEILYVASMTTETGVGLRTISAEDVDSDSADSRERMAFNETVAVMRLMASAQPMEEAMAGLATSERGRELFRLRTAYIGEAPAVSHLLGALELEKAVGRYKMSLYTAQRPYRLELELQSAPDDPAAVSAALEQYAPVLLALIGNLDEVGWSSPDGTAYTAQVPADLPEQVEAVTHRRYDSLKDMGNTAQGISDLLQVIGIE